MQESKLRFEAELERFKRSPSEGMGKGHVHTGGTLPHQIRRGDNVLQSAPAGADSWGLRQVREQEGGEALAFGTSAEGAPRAGDHGAKEGAGMEQRDAVERAASLMELEQALLKSRLELHAVRYGGNAKGEGEEGRDPGTGAGVVQLQQARIAALENQLEVGIRGGYFDSRNLSCASLSLPLSLCVHTHTRFSLTYTHNSILQKVVTTFI